MSSKMSAAAVRALLLLDLPDTRLFLCDEECYLIRKPTPKHLTTRVYDALYDAGFISHPRYISKGLAECQITPGGHARAVRIREDMNEYYQLCLFEDTEETEGAPNAETMGQLCLFDEDIREVAASKRA